MPIVSDGKVYEDEYSFETGRPIEPPGSTQTQGGTPVPSSENNASAGNVGQTRGIVDKLLGTTGERYQTWPEKMVRGAVSAFALPGDVLSGKVESGSVQEIERAADLAGLMIGGPAPVASKMAEGTLGSFAGVTSKTFDKGALEVAQAAEKEGLHPEEIWNKTGFFRGADNRWRYEIVDKDAKINEKGFDRKVEADMSGEEIPTISVKEFGTTVGEALDHPELFKAYPHLKNVGIYPLPEQLAERGVIGQMAEGNMYLKNDLHPDFVRSVILHELSHEIQKKEGFARGGSAPEFEHPNLKKAKKLYEEALAKGGDPESESLKKAKAILDEEKDKSATLYRRLMGEVEARNVQTRMDFDELMSMQIPPRLTEDTPRFLQIPAEQGKAVKR
jgi:hypothetical protein